MKFIIHFQISKTFVFVSDRILALILIPRVIQLGSFKFLIPLGLHNFHEHCQKKKHFIIIIKVCE